MKKNLLYLIGMLIALTSCNSDFLKEYSQDLSRAKTADDMNELLVGDCTLPLGLFELSNSYFSYKNENYAMLHFMSDELTENVTAGNDPQQVSIREMMFPYFTWQQNLYLDYEGKATLQSDEENYWNLAYQKISKCNILIKESDDIGTSSDKEKTLLQTVKGEAYYLRASYYLMLVNLYAKPYAPSTAETTPAVPIKTTEKVEDKDYTRESVSAVYQQIIADLTSAEQLLDGVTKPASIYHVGIEAVYILRSRVALYMQDWTTAQQYAKKAISTNGKLQSLIGLTSATYPINKDNPEVIYSNGSSCLGNLLFQEPQKTSKYDGPYQPVYYASSHLVKLYDKTDSRLATYLTNEDDLGNHTYTYHKIDNSAASWGKYKDVSDVFSIRTAEGYLNLAEADAHLGNDAEACQTLTTLRAARIADATAVSLSGSSLVTFVREERERELCFEGHRWFDLRRYTVDEKYPYSETIEHTMSYYHNTYNPPYKIDTYRLEKNDDAYTLNIPKTVREFQPSIGSNSRPLRSSVSSNNTDGE
jgi:hypothetical protein